MGSDALETLSILSQHRLAFESQLPPDRVVNVHYQQLVDDPIATVARIYDHFNRPVQPQMKTAMNQWLAEHPRHKHGVHRYSLEQFGIDPHDLDRVAHPYHEAFDVPREAS